MVVIFAPAYHLDFIQGEEPLNETKGEREYVTK